MFCTNHEWAVCLWLASPASTGWRWWVDTNNACRMCQISCTRHYWYLHQVKHSSRWASQTKQKLSVHLDSRGVKQRQRGVKKTKENERDDDDDDDDECKGGKPKLKHWLKVGDRHYKQKRLADKYRYFRNKTNPVNHHRSSHATPTHATSPGLPTAELQREQRKQHKQVFTQTM